MTRDEIINVLRIKRNQLKISREKLSDLTGISVITFLRFENKQKNMCIEKIIKYAESIGMEVVIRDKQDSSNEQQVSGKVLIKK
jgi:transcriptional regulator with XRE-family HTH domain